MSTKTTIVANRTTNLAAGDYTFDVTDPTSFKTLKMDGGSESLLSLVRQNRGGDGWEPVFSDGRQVHLHRANRTATPSEVGTYSVEGAVAGSITLWTEEI
jgi:hypothetical protein